MKRTVARASKRKSGTNAPDSRRRRAPGIVSSLGARLQPVVAAVLGDLHSNSTMGLCPPEGFLIDDGSEYQPNKLQAWIWQQFLDYCGEVGELRRREGARLVMVVNGEFSDGDHHQTSQIATRNHERMMEAAKVCIEPLKMLTPDAWYVTRGTEAHSGKNGSMDESMAQHLKAHKHDETGLRSCWKLRLELSGVGFEIAHHGRNPGTVPNTKGAGTNREAMELVYEYADEPWKPKVAVRNHFHVFADSADNHRIRVFQNGAWQLKTAFAHRVAPNSKPEVGGLYFLCRDGQYVARQFRRGADLPPKVVVFS